VNTSVIGGGFRFSSPAVGGNWSWEVAVQNIVNSGQKILVRDIRTPFGPIYTTEIPIPDSIILAMADSVSQFQQQLNPQVFLISSATYFVTVTEDDPVSSIATNLFENIGQLGSFMTVTSVPDSPWLTAYPPSVSGIMKNGQGQSAISITPTLLLATSSPYVGHVNLQDNANPPNIVPVTFNVTVLPRPTIGVSVSTVNLFFSMTSGAGSSQTVVITNTGPGGSLLTFNLVRVLNRSSWLDINPVSEANVPSAGTVNVIFSVDTNHIPGLPGTYSEQILIQSDNATNTPVTILVSLNVVA
jgi:hypothetical protein